MNVPEEVTELGKVHLIFDIHTLQKFIQVQIFGVDLETELTHDHLELIFELLILEGVLMEIPLEDGMHKDLVPTHPLFFMDLQTTIDEVFGLGSQIIVELVHFGLNVFNEFKLCMGSPRSTVVQ